MAINGRARPAERAPSVLPAVPVAPRHPGDLPLVGRATELALVVGALRQGSGAAIVGDGGVGKTRLAREALDILHEADTVWLAATESARSVPLAAVTRLLPDGDLGTDRAALFRRAGAALAASRPRGLLIVVDDAHLLDAPSAAFVHHLATTGVARLLLTLRRDADGPDAIRVLWKDGHARRVDLAALGDAETSALVETALSGPTTASLRRWFREHSMGNPLALSELLLAARTARCLEEKSGVWRLVGDPPLSPQLLDLVRARLSGLEAGHRRALELVALGEPVPRAALERLTAPRVLEELERSGTIITERLDDTWAVRTAHPILGEGVRADLPEGARVRLLEVLAEGLDATLERRTDLLRIAELRLAARSPMAPETLLEAAAEALRLCLHDRVVPLAAAAEAAGAGPPAAAIQAQALSLLGRHHEAARALSGIDRSGLSRRLAASVLAVEAGSADLRGQQFSKVSALLDDATGWHPDTTWARTIAVLRTGLLVRAGRYGDGIELGGMLHRTDDDRGETQEIGVALGPIMSEALLAVGRSADALEAVREAPSTADPGPCSLLAWAAVRLRTGRAWDQVEAIATAAHHRSLAAADPTAATVAATVLGRLALARGRPLTAARWLGDAVVELGDTDPHGTLIPSLSALACAQAIAGSDASPTLERLDVVLDQRPSGPCDDIEIARARAWAAAASGELTRARSLVLTAAKSTEEAITEEAFLLHDALRLGTPPVEVSARLGQLAGLTDNPLVDLLAAHAEGAAGNDGGGLETVAGAFEELGADLLAAEAWSAAAGGYRYEGRAGSAQRAATRSWALAERCEGAATPWLSRSDEAIVLSLREREVAALAARGVPNARIAERLSLSVRTVESHVYRAMTKLGVRHRDELGAVLGVESTV